MKRAFEGDEDATVEGGPLKRVRSDDAVHRDSLDYQRIKKIVARVGDKDIGDAPAHYRNAAFELNIEIGQYQNTVIDLIIRCVIDLPIKTVPYAIITALLNAKSPVFGQCLLGTARDQLIGTLRSGERRAAKMLLRYFATLVHSGVITIASLGDILIYVLDAAMSESAPQLFCDNNAYLVMATLPWCAVVLEERRPKIYDQVFEDLEAYMKDRKSTSNPAHSILGGVDATAEEVRQEDVLVNLYTTVTRGVDDAWACKSIPDIDDELKADWSEAVTHEVEEIGKIAYDDEAFFSPLGSRLELFTDYPAVPPSTKGDDISPLDRFVIKEYTRDTLFTLFPEAKEAAKRLAALPVDLPAERLVLEGLFECLMSLPSPALKPIYFSIVLLHLVRVGKTVFPQALAKSFARFFDKASVLDITIVDRFTHAFALHLSNFAWKWPWDRWSHVLDQHDLHPQRLIVSDVLQRCLFLTYHENLNKTIPDEFQALMPPLPNPVEPFDDNDSSRSAALFRALVNKMQIDKTNLPADEILDFLYGDHAELNEDHPGTFATTVTAALLLSGNFVMSHLRSQMLTYKVLLKKVISNQSERVAALSTISTVYAASPQMTVWTIGKLHALMVLDLPSVIEWIFSRMSRHFTRFYLWDILEDVLNRIIEQEDSVTVEMDVARFEKDLTKLARLEKRFDEFRSQLVKAFPMIFERFAKVLRDYLRDIDGDGEDYNDTWFRHTVGRLRAVGRTYKKQLLSLKSELVEVKVGQMSSDERINPYFREIEAIYS